MKIAVNNPKSIPSPSINVDFHTSALRTFTPFCTILSAIKFWKIKPNPTGIAIYGIFNPNAKTQATARLSSLISFITLNRGGIIIGMKAI